MASLVNTELETEAKEKRVKDLLKVIGKRYEDDDKPAHDFYRRRARKLELYWNGIQDVIWSEINREFRLVSEVNNSLDDDEMEDFDTTINVFRAYGESIIAAAATGLPHVRFFPEDADNPDDILASKASSKLSELISHHNNAQFLFVHALFILYTQTILAFYNYPETDKSYGTIQQPILKLETYDKSVSVCPECQFETEDPEITNCPECQPEIGAEIAPYDPEGGILGAAEAPMGPPLQQEIRQDTRIAQEGMKEIPKTREIIEVWGTANIKLPYYVKNPKDSPYLVLETEQHVSLLRDLYPDKYDDIRESTTDPENYRRPTDGYTFDNKGLATVKRFWLRPWAYNILPDRQDAEFLKSEYPDGVYYVQINDEVMECRSEKFEDHWSIYRDPLSSHINTEPLGQPVVPVQDMRNDLVYLSMDTIKHGVGETFVDSDVLNWDTYKDHRNKTGTVIPINRKNKSVSLDGSFYASKTATLSKEVNDFFFLLSRDGEFMSRAMPSIFGGEESGSGTLGEHESKKNQALQRLTLPWKSLNIVYAECMEKAVRDFKDNMLEDEKFVKQTGTSYVNVWIRRGDMSGKTGKVISETSDQFPLTWLQKKDLLLNMLSLNKPPIEATLFHSENVTTVAQIFGMPDLHIPGEDDRNKQLMEILELVQGQPVQDQMGIASPSVPIEPEVDDDQIHIDTCRAWCNSDEGLETKQANPQGYNNVIAHLQAHIRHQQEQMMAQMPLGGENPPLEGGEEEMPPQEAPNA